MYDNWIQPDAKSLKQIGTVLILEHRYTVQGQQFLLSVGVVDRLVHQVILEQDIPVLLDFVNLCKPVNVKPKCRISRNGFHLQVGNKLH